MLSPAELAALRKEYSTRGLRRKDLAANPFDQFGAWFQEASDHQLLEPNAMSLATTGKDGKVRARTVLMKAFDEKGFVFFTNYQSTKAADLAENPQAALLFPWVALERQICISGTVEKVSRGESLDYFNLRPLGSRLGAWVSHQSSVIPSREFLEARLSEIKKRFPSDNVDLPDFWGGYRVIPETIEFWQGAASRLHDRFLYSRLPDNTWKIERLSP